MGDVALVLKVTELLRGLGDHEPHGATTSELARTAQVSRSTAHRILTTLHTRGLVERHGAGARWLLGPETFLLGTTCAPRYDVRSVAEPEVRRLAADTGESAHLSVRRGDETACILREEGSFPLRSHVLHVGIRLPLGVASAGLAVLAWLDAEARADFLDRVDLTAGYGPAHVRSLVEDRVARTRDDGWSLNPGLIVQGSWGMAAAIFSPDGAPVAALSLTGVEQRFGPDRQVVMGGLLMRSAHRLTDVLAAGAAAPGARRDGRAGAGTVSSATFPGLPANRRGRR